MSEENTEVIAQDAGQTAEANVDTSTTQPGAADTATGTGENTVSQKDFNKAYWKQKQTERENEDLKRQLGERTPAPQLGTTTEAEAINGEPTLDQFDYDTEAHTRALVDYRVKQGISAAFYERDTRSKEAKQQEANAKVSQTFNDRYAEYASANPDYQEIATAAGNKAFAPHINQAILYADNGPQIDHHLLMNPQEAERLNAMHPTTAAMELGKLSVKLSAKAPIKTSNAPDPIETVGGGGSPSSDNRYTSGTSMEDYYKTAMVGAIRKR